MCRLLGEDRQPNGLAAKIGISDGEIAKISPHRATGERQACALHRAVVYAMPISLVCQETFYNQHQGHDGPENGPGLLYRQG